MPRTKLTKQVQKFAERAAELEAKGYTLINPPSMWSGGTLNTAENAYQNAMESLGCGCKSSGCGSEIDPNLMRYVGSKDSIQKVPETGADGKQLGTPNLGYVRYGLSDRLPLHIFRVTHAQPYTATALSFNTDLVSGKGVELLYETAVFTNGKVEIIKMPYEYAGCWLEGRIQELRQKIEERDAAQAEQQPASLLPVDSGYLRAIGKTPDKAEYRTAPPPPAPAPSASVDHQVLGTLDYQLSRLFDDYDAWIDTQSALEKFQEETKLDKLYQACMVDDQHLDMFTIIATLEQGRRGSWEPKICRLEHKPMVCVRLEEKAEDCKSHYIYYSEKFMYDTGEVKGVVMSSKDLVSFPLLQTDTMESELSAYIAQNQKTAVASRQLHWAVIGQQPSGFTAYYAQPTWWSIFSSLVFQYVSTLMYDKAAARQNATMWGKLIYINNNYLQQYFADAGATTTEQKKALRDELVSGLNDFLRERKNNGKTCTLDSFIAPGTNTVIKSIEIIDVPQPSSGSTNKEDMEELANLVFWAFKIHTSMIASFGKNPSSGGTQQRELFLLKQIMMSNRQRRFKEIINSVFHFNKWDKHLKCDIGREVLSTLDASKTGIVEE